MKLRLGPVGKDVAHRFGISNTLCTQIFHSWIRGMADNFRSFIFVPDIEKILAATPRRYRHFENLIGIIDSSKIFIEIPKNLELQSAPWSEYKHHNTLCVCVSLNSALTFVSKAYTGRISDKEIILKPDFLDMLPKVSNIMADKGFNLFDVLRGAYISQFPLAGEVHHR